MSDTTRTRRDVLTTLTWTAGLALGGLAAPPEPQAAAAELAVVLQFLIYRVDAVSRIGTLYRSEHPAENRPALHRLTLGSLPPAPGGTTASLAQRLTERVRQDYAAEDTVRIDGWVLARTEARLCALFA